jgi:hypothetical protein
MYFNKNKLIRYFSIGLMIIQLLTIAGCLYIAIHAQIRDYGHVDDMLGLFVSGFLLFAIYNSILMYFDIKIIREKEYNRKETTKLIILYFLTIFPLIFITYIILKGMGIT